MGAQFEPSSTSATPNAHRTSVPAYAFGHFRVDVENRFLFRDDAQVPLTPKVFDALLFLVERSGKLVTKDELMSALWPGTFVSDSNLTQTIFVLRKALGESASEQRYVMTVPGRGYRFAGEVRTQPVEPARLSASPPTRWHHAKWAVLCVSVVAIAALLYWYAGRSSPANDGRTSAQQVMLAVLPFENLTGDASQEYFSEGFTEDMILEAGKLDPQRIRVIAYTSVAHYKKPQQAIPQIGRELSVQYVLKGAIHRNANNVVIDTELIRVADQRLLWTNSYQRDLDNVASVPATIAKDLSNIVEGKSPRPPSISPVAPSNYQAYDLQLKARYSLSKRTAQSLRQAADYFRQAIALDTNNARAYSGLASASALMASYRLAPQGEFIPGVRVAALRAIQLDNRNSEAHTALALITQNYDWDWNTAEREYRRAIELDPNNATARQWYAEHLALRGRFDEAFAEIERARQLDPESLIIATDHATILFYARQYEEAIRRYRAILELEPTFTHAYMVIDVYLAEHRLRDAESALARWREIDNNEWTTEAEGLLYAMSGRVQAAQSVIAKLQATDRKAPVDPAVFAGLYVAMGKNDLAFVALEKARRQHSIALTTLKVHPGWDPLREDPRFKVLLRSVNLEP